MKKILLGLAALTVVLIFLACSSPTSGETGGSFGNTSPDYTSANIGTLKYVPAGTFVRDFIDEANTSTVSAFRMSEHEITMEQFVAVTGYSNPSTFFTGVVKGPVQYVNWYHAITFCNKLSLKEGLTPAYSVKVGGTPVNWSTLAYADIPVFDHPDWNAAVCNWNASGYRLPTEMEWEWAAMGATSDRSNGYTGTGTNPLGFSKMYAGSTESGANTVNIGNYAWYNANSTNTTHAVGGKTANELGLFDMSGNVSEWCWDWYVSYPSGALNNYRGADSGTSRILRSGHWNESTDQQTVASRSMEPPNTQFKANGFRVVRP